MSTEPPGNACVDCGFSPIAGLRCIDCGPGVEPAATERMRFKDTVPIEVDEAAAVVYVRLSDAPVARTSERVPNTVLVDYASDGYPVGVEIHLPGPAVAAESLPRTQRTTTYTSATEANAAISAVTGRTTMAVIELRREHDHRICANCGSHWFKCCAVFNNEGRPVARTTDVQCAECGTPATI